MQIVRRGSHQQSAGIFEPSLRQRDLRFVLRCKWTEPQPIANTSVVDALNLIKARVFMACRAFGREADWRRRRVQIDHEGPCTTKTTLNIQDWMSIQCHKPPQQLIPTPGNLNPTGVTRNVIDVAHRRQSL
jgi:hypothetical protein